MKPDISKEFLFEYFRGKASSMQKQLIDNWVKDPENEDFFYQCLEEWERQYPQYMVDVKEGVGGFRNSLKQNASQKDESDSRGYQKQIRFSRTWFWAASCLIALSGLVWHYQENLLYARYTTAPGEVSSYSLPDGSSVTLNANSLLSVSRFWKLLGEREVILSGEAEFQVTREVSARKFVVKTNNNIDIVVHGTVFTVFNRHQRTSVTLNEGKVQLTQHIGDLKKTIDMVPGDKVMAEANHPLILESVEDFSEVPHWKEKRFEFSQTSLESISEILKDYYNIDASFSTADLETHTISGSFVATSDEVFLEYISILTGLRYLKKNQTVIFHKENP